MKKSTAAATARALDSREAKEVAAAVERAMRQLKLAADASPAKAQRAIRARIDATVAGKRKLSRRTRAELAVTLGCLWGHTACRAARWRWRMSLLRDQPVLTIASPNSSHVVFPAQFILAQFAKRPPEENTSLLLFNMLVAGGKTLPPAEAGAYLRLG